MKVMLSKLLLLVICLNQVSAQDANCNFNQNVQTGQTYYVYSPNYPGNYSAGVSCRWIATCSAGYNCQLDCSDIRLPQSQNCVLDRLLISRSGDSALAGADVFCGTGSTSIKSSLQRISVGLLSSSNSPGGRFLCTLRAVAQEPNNTCSCGWKKTNRIVGGVETGVNEFPSMAGLVDVRISEIKCGGAIISIFHIVTAAHCLLGHTTATLAAIVGEHDVTIGDSPATQLLRLSRLLRHASFNDNNYDYDIGIVTTSTAIVFSDRVGPVCLPFKYTATSFAGALVEALGWGTLSPGGPTSNTLQKVTLNVISNTQCSTRINSLTSRQICTFTPGKDACQDDSGGPLLYSDQSTGLLFLVGSISSGQFCASGENPGLNTRISSLLQWIQDNTPGTIYCRK